MELVSLPLVEIVVALVLAYVGGVLTGWAIEYWRRRRWQNLARKQLALIDALESQLQDAWRKIHEMKEATDA